LLNFEMTWDDISLATHHFRYGSMTGYGDPTSAEEMQLRKFHAGGVATVEFPELLEALFGIERTDPFWSTEPLLRRFGARVNDNQSIAGLSAMPQAEFWAAVHSFQENWASQFKASIPMTFMPELFPGMILRLPDYEIQFYVTAVTHNFDFGQGGGFTTTASVVAPSKPDGSGLHDYARESTKPGAGV
jgi:hypothetical protein